MIKMRDKAKVELFDELLACAMQSSHAMDETVRALVSNPLHTKKSSTGPLRKRRDRFTIVPIATPFMSLSLSTISHKRCLKSP
jgi:hypothetical protein